MLCNIRWTFDTVWGQSQLQAHLSGRVCFNLAKRCFPESSRDLYYVRGEDGQAYCLSWIAKISRTWHLRYPRQTVQARGNRTRRTSVVSMCRQNYRTLRSSSIPTRRNACQGNPEEDGRGIPLLEETCIYAYFPTHREKQNFGSWGFHQRRLDLKTEKRYVAEFHYGLGHKPSTVEEAMNIAEAKAAVDKYLDQLKNLLALDFKKVKQRQKWFDRQKITEPNIYLSASYMDFCHLETCGTCQSPPEKCERKNRPLGGQC